MWQPCNSMQSHGITVKEKWLYYILYMLISQQVYIKQGFPGGSVVKNLPASAGDRFEPWVGKTPWRKKWQPISQFSCLGNSMDREAWPAMVRVVAKSQT